MERSKNGAKIDASKIVDLNDEDNEDLLNEDIIIDLGVKNMEEKKKGEKGQKKDKVIEETSEE